MVIDDNGPLYIEQSGDLESRFWTGVKDALRTDSLTHSQTLKDKATQLLIKYN